MKSLVIELNAVEGMPVRLRVSMDQEQYETYVPDDKLLEFGKNMEELIAKLLGSNHLGLSRGYMTRTD